MPIDMGTIILEILKDEKTTVDEKSRLLNELRKSMTPANNRWNAWYVLFGLIAIAIAAPVFFVVALYLQKPPELPQALISLSATAVGALAAYLTTIAQARQ
jgi:uncharacterized integral membrane protein